MNMPVVSVVMPCYNAAGHLALSTGSVRAQTWTDWELVIVDDGSTDASWEILDALSREDSRIRVFRQANSGASRTRNHGLREVRGEFVAFLDSDDTWEPAFLEKMLAALQAAPDAVLAYCGWQNLGLVPNLCKPFVPRDYEGPGKLAALLEECRWPIHAALTRAAIIKAAGCFDEDLTSCMDFDLWLRIGTQHRIVLVPEVLAYYHHHGGEQITKNRARNALNHLKAQENFVRDHPDMADKLSSDQRRKLIYGELLRRGYENYWKRNLPAARIIFRRVMRAGYGNPKDWMYMLPALLPLTLHRLLLQRRDAQPE